MRLPTALTLEEMRQCFRSVQQDIKPLTSGNLELGGRRVVGAGRPIDPFDYVRLYDLGVSDDESAAVASRVIPKPRVAVFASRGIPAGRRGQIFIASDRNYVGWVSTGTAWQYLLGIETGTLSNLRSGLTTNDVGYLFEVTDYDHVLQWTGSAWTWGPGEVGSGFIAFYVAAPSSIGANAWQVCDGSTVARLNATGGTTNVTVPDYSTPAYVKAATAAGIGPTAASGTAANKSLNVTGVAVQSGTGVTVVGSVDDPHNHDPGTLELRRTELIAYYRR